MCACASAAEEEEEEDAERRGQMKVTLEKYILLVWFECVRQPCRPFSTMEGLSGAGGLRELQLA